MKRFASLMILALMGTTASMAGNLGQYTNILDLLNNDNVVLYTYWGCGEEGYNLVDSNWELVGLMS